MNSDTLPAVGRMSPELVDVFILLGAMAGVVLIIFLCALIFRANDGKRHHHHHRRHRKHFFKQFRMTASGIKEMIRNRRQRSHRERRSLNPTLAQTGGLPPIRRSDKPMGSPPPSPSPPKT